MPRPTELRSIREKGDRARELSKLLEHPSWQTLVVECNEAIQRGISRTAQEMLVGREISEPIDQRKIDYRRGFIRGVEEVLKSPENAILLLEEELKKEQAANG